MRIERVTAHAFGPFSGESLELAPGLTVVERPERGRQVELARRHPRRDRRGATRARCGDQGRGAVRGAPQAVGRRRSLGGRGAPRARRRPHDRDQPGPRRQGRLPRHRRRPRPRRLRRDHGRHARRLALARARSRGLRRDDLRRPGPDRRDRRPRDRRLAPGAHAACRRHARDRCDRRRGPREASTAFRRVRVGVDRQGARGPAPRGQGAGGGGARGALAEAQAAPRGLPRREPQRGGGRTGGRDAGAAGGDDRGRTRGRAAAELTRRAERAVGARLTSPHRARRARRP